jgi:DNA-binding winged helix-turn-helix (wHTH) protein/TolB-like protein
VAEQFRFGEFEFDAGSHELRRADRSGDVQRLAPQPGQLLQLLAARGGGIVTREEIRQQLWPETHVDFDASLHFCVRQVRAALGDSAGEPRYIQNVPRRGYRLIPDVTSSSAVAPAPATSAPATAPPHRRPRSVATWGAASLGLVLVAVAAVWWGTRDVPSPAPVRIAIMPFEPPIAERILEDLMAIAGDTVALVGPTTTSAYAASDADIRRLAVAYRLDYVINRRPVRSDGRPRVLAELIRVSDGAHVWVRSYEDLTDGERVGQEIGQHVAQVLNLRR